MSNSYLKKLMIVKEFTDNTNNDKGMKIQKTF